MGTKKVTTRAVAFPDSSERKTASSDILNIDERRSLHSLFPKQFSDALYERTQKRDMVCTVDLDYPKQPQDSGDYPRITKRRSSKNKFGCSGQRCKVKRSKSSTRKAKKIDLKGKAGKSVATTYSIEPEEKVIIQNSFEKTLDIKTNTTKESKVKIIIPISDFHSSFPMDTMKIKIPQSPIHKKKESLERRFKDFQSIEPCIHEDLATIKTMNNKITNFDNKIQISDLTQSTNNTNSSFLGCISFLKSKSSRKQKRKANSLLVMKEFDSYDDLIVKASNIHGLGIFTPVEIATSTLIMEYKGEIIGKCMSDKRERYYKENNIQSVYMFKLSDDKIIDATMIGNKARYINHSCHPNCEALYSGIDKSIKYCSIRKISKGEELTIDYNMSRESVDEACNCGHPECKVRKETSHVD